MQPPGAASTMTHAFSHRLDDQHSPALQRELRTLLSQLGLLSAQPQRIAVKTGRQTQFIPTADIRYVATDGNYVVLHTIAGTYRMRATLKDMKEQLGCDSFVRIHRQTIVNIDFVREIEMIGAHCVILDNGEELSISRTYRPRLMELIARWGGEA